MEKEKEKEDIENSRIRLGR